MAQTAVVTGATGFVATELVKQLLAKGYNVRGTVRDPNDASKVQTLTKLSDALPGKLDLYAADLLTDGSFDKAVGGADYVFHTASPFFIKADDPHKDLIQPAVHGTKNLLSSVLKSKQSVKRVVLTSSVAAIIGIKDTAPPKNGSVYTEEDWNVTSMPENEAYFVSKTKAEEAAWEVARKESLDLVTICPNFVQGPVTSSRVGGTSVGHMKSWLEGSAGGNPVYVDVRDVARAHILAAETPSASGRYIISQPKTSNPKLVGQWLQERFPQFVIPAGEDKPEEDKVSNQKVQELGVSITPLKETVIDMAVTLIQLGIASPSHK